MLRVDLYIRLTLCLQILGYCNAFAKSRRRDCKEMSWSDVPFWILLRYKNDTRQLFRAHDRANICIGASFLNGSLKNTPRQHQASEPRARRPCSPLLQGQGVEKIERAHAQPLGGRDVLQYVTAKRARRPRDGRLRARVRKVRAPQGRTLDNVQEGRPSDSATESKPPRKR